jgi:hypothetical protein
MAKKPFKETKVGKFLKEKGGDLLDTAGSLITGNWVDAAGQIKDLITNSDKLDPEQKEIALKYLEQDLEAMRLELEDRKDARAMQVAALQQDDIFSKRFTYYFITAWSLFSMTYMICTTFMNIPEANMRMADTFQGFLLGTAVSGMFAFLLGSTNRSRQKDDTIAKLTK